MGCWVKAAHCVLRVIGQSSMKKKNVKSNKIQKKSNIWLEYLILNVLVLIGLILVLQLWNTNIFKYPLSYFSDALQVLYNTNKLQETGLFGYSVRASYPYYAYMSDFPSLGIVEQFFRWLLVVILGNTAAAINLFYLSGYFLAATASYWALKKLEVSEGIAGLVSILYAFMPYHFLRGIQHLGFSMYWPLPVFLYFCISYMKGQPGYTKGEKGWLTKNNIIHIAVLVLLGGGTVYYTYFSCFFICMIILFLIIRKEQWKKLKQPFIDLGIMLGSLLLTIIPYVINISKYGSNDEVAARSASDVEKYSLKIAQLIMPITDHRISFFADIKAAYNQLPLTNENRYAALGLLFSLGFLILLMELIKHKHDDEDVYVCSMLNIGCLLLGTIGGVASIISLFFTKIRCYNRISIFIAFLAAVAFAKYADKYFKRKRTWGYWVTCSLLLGIGLFDQTSDSFIPSYEKVNTKWESDEYFVAEIESMEKEGAKIYQMPYTAYPEGAGRNNMTSYDHVIGYIHSDSLIWSYGCSTGREGDLWNSYVATLDIEEQVKNIYLNGFDGIYLDSYAYTDDEFERLTEKLTAITATEPIISDNKRLYYFTLKKYDASVLNDDDRLYAKTYMSFEEGFYYIERNETDSWVWCSGEGDINIYNGTEDDMSVTLDMNIMTLTQKGNYQFMAKVNDKQYSFVVKAGQNNYVSLPVVLEPGENIISLESDVPCVEIEGDARELAFNVRNFSYSENTGLEE